VALTLAPIVSKLAFLKSLLLKVLIAVLTGILSRMRLNPKKLGIAGGCRLQVGRESGRQTFSLRGCFFVKY
jgi:hypothetical protein